VVTASEAVIPMSRIDDAVTRILRVKLRAGVFDAKKPSQPPDARDASAIAPHELAARAVHESLVLLKNNGNALPLRRQQKVLVVGASADSIQNQTGGWSRNWQGGPDPDDPAGNHPNTEYPSGQSILAGIQSTVGASNVTYSVDASNVDVRSFGVVIAVIGELPYAEFFGDIATAPGNWRHPADLSMRTLEHGHRYPQDRAVLEAVSGKGVPVVTVLLSGRVLYTNAEINRSDAFVAAWLPGTEGAAISDVLFRRPDGEVNVNFTGRLPFSWPRSACQEANVGDPGYRPQFPFGYGLSYPTRLRVGTLDQMPGPAGGCTD
jgi:beta-glucosidase